MNFLLMRFLTLQPEQPTSISQSDSLAWASSSPKYQATQRLLTVFLLTIALTLLTLLPVAAQSFEAKVEFFVDSPTPEGPITIGDPVTLRLEVTHPNDSRVILPQLAEDWHEFELVEQSSPDFVDHQDGTVTTGQNIVVRLFRPGEYQTPKLVITHYKADDSTEDLAAPVVPIQVTSILTEDTNLRDIKPQAILPVPAIWPWLLGGFMLIMCLVGMLLTAAFLYYHYYWRNRPVSGPIPVPVIDTRPPELIAHLELDRIEALNLRVQHKFKEHYTLIIVCLRHYIEGRYDIPALEQTTTELRYAFKKSVVPMRDTADFMSIFTESDLVKFARHTPQVEDGQRLLYKARAVIDITTPQPEADPDPPQITTSKAEASL